MQLSPTLNADSERDEKPTLPQPSQLTKSENLLCKRAKARKDSLDPRTQGSRTAADSERAQDSSKSHSGSRTSLEFNRRDQRMLIVARALNPAPGIQPRRS